MKCSKSSTPAVQGRRSWMGRRILENPSVPNSHDHSNRIVHCPSGSLLCSSPSSCCCCSSPSPSPSSSSSSSSSSNSGTSPPKRIRQEDNNKDTHCYCIQDANSGRLCSASLPPSTSDSSLTATRQSPSPKCSSYGSVSLIGRRREMEDAVTVAPGIMPEYDFFGVYDGHGGKQVSEWCRERMHVVFKGEVERRRCPPLDLIWREVMEDCFKKVDAEVMEIAQRGSSEEKTVGSTAVVAIVSADRIIVANCGDCRTVLCRNGITVPLSSDHKPNRADEMERVESAGGRVIDWDGFRVLGVLATSRSIGDQYLKPFVTSEPEVTVTARTEKDEFLILASDGLWDVVPSEVACGLTRMCLNQREVVMNRRCGGTFAATALAELAMSRGSRDNISVVVVVF